jgi:hypothetical protein
MMPGWVLSAVVGAFFTLGLIAIFLMIIAGLLERSAGDPGAKRWLTIITWFAIAVMTPIAGTAVWFREIWYIALAAILVVVGNVYLLVARRREVTRRDSGIVLPPERRTRREPR